MVSEKKFLQFVIVVFPDHTHLLFFLFSYYKSMGANDPRGLANLDPSDMIGRIYLGYL